MSLIYFIYSKNNYIFRLDNKSRHSMSSGNKPGPESDTDSMAEYGEGETGMSPPCRYTLLDERRDTIAVVCVNTNCSLCFLLWLSRFDEWDQYNVPKLFYFYFA